MSGTPGETRIGAWQAREAEVDGGGMRFRIAAFPDDLATAVPAAADFAAGLRPDPAPGLIVVVGMGGSAIAADLVAAWTIERRRRPLVVLRTPDLPRWLEGDAVVIASSYSGDTAETLAAYAEAKARGLRAVAITTGGALAERARAAGDRVHLLPGGSPPRAALGASLAACALVVAQLDPGLALEPTRAALAAAADGLGESRSAWSSWEPANPALEIAASLADRLPILVAGHPLTVAAARRWKAQLNENGKIPAWTSELPEHNHNEIVGFEGGHPTLSHLAHVFLETPWDDPEVTRRMDFVHRYCAARIGVQHRVRMPAPTPLDALLRLCWLGDWVSFFVSIVTGHDPTPVTSIDQLKSELADGGDVPTPDRREA